MCVYKYNLSNVHDLIKDPRRPVTSTFYNSTLEDGDFNPIWSSLYRQNLVSTCISVAQWM